MCNSVARDTFFDLGESVIDLAINNVQMGGLPFAAIIVNQSGKIIGKGVNQVATNLDCTAHAEIQAIRNASLNENTVSLEGATLIASGEPCALCYMAILMSQISTLVILADKQEAKEHGFDYLWTYEYLNSSSLKGLNIVKLESKRKMLPFKLCTVGLSEAGLKSPL